MSSSEDENQEFRLFQSARAFVAHVRGDSLLRNSLLIMSTMVVNSAFGYLLWLLVARMYSTEVVGLAAALIAAGTIVILLASLGVGGMLVQSLPEQGKPAGWSVTFWAGMGTAITIGLTLGCVTLVLLPLITEELAVLQSAGYAVVFVTGSVALTAGAVLDHAFIAERAAGSMLGRNAVVSAGKVVLTLVLSLVVGTSALTVLGAWALAALVGLGLGVGLLVRRMTLLGPPPPFALARSARGLRSRLAGQQLIGMGGALLPYVLPVLVTVRLSSSDNAYFYTTWMMAGFFLIVAPAVSLSLFAEGANSPHELRTKARSALAVIGAIIVPGAVAILVTGGMVLSTFGPGYAENGVGLLQIVLLASIPDAITNVYVSVLRVQGRLVSAAGLTLGMGVGVLVLSWAFLPVLGINAVGWAFLAMQGSGCLFVAFDLLRRPARASAAESASHWETP